MAVITRQFSLDMQGATQIENITEKVKNNLLDSELVDGIITLFIKHFSWFVHMPAPRIKIRHGTSMIWKSSRLQNLLIHGNI